MAGAGGVSMRAGLGMLGEQDAHARDLMISLVGYVERIALATAVAGAMYEGRAESPTADDLIRGLMAVTMDGSTLRKCEEVWAAYQQGRAIDFQTHGITVREATEMMMYMGMSRDEMQRAVIRSFFSGACDHGEEDVTQQAAAGSTAAGAPSPPATRRQGQSASSAGATGTGTDAGESSDEGRDSDGSGSVGGSDSSDSIDGAADLTDEDYLAWKSARQRWSSFTPSTALEAIVQKAVARAMEHQQQTSS